MKQVKIDVPKDKWCVNFMCAMDIKNHDAESLFFCTYSVAGYLTSEALDYRNVGGLNNRWHVAKIECAFVGLFIVAVVEGVFRLLIGMVAAIFAKANSDLIRTIAWNGAAICFDTALRDLAGLVRNVTQGRVTYEDLMVYPLFNLPNDAQDAEESHDAAIELEKSELSEDKPVSAKEVQSEIQMHLKMLSDESGKLKQAFRELDSYDPDTVRKTEEVLHFYMTSMQNYFKMRVQQIREEGFSPLELQAGYKQYAEIAQLAHGRDLLNEEERTEHQKIVASLNALTQDSAVQFPWRAVSPEAPDVEEEESNFEEFEEGMRAGVELLREGEKAHQTDEFIANYLGAAVTYLTENEGDEARIIFGHYNEFYSRVKHRLSVEDHEHRKKLYSKFQAS